MKITILAPIIFLVILQGIQVTFAAEACNEYVDGILRDLKEDKEYFQDPYDIPEKSIELHKKVIFINYTGEASIYDGHIYGLSSIHRDGDVVVDKGGKNTHLKIWLGGGEIKMQCSGRVKLMGHGPQVKVDAKMAYINMKLDIVAAGKNANPKVSSLKIEDVKALEVKVSGLGPLNFFLNNYINIMGKVFKNLIRNAIENKLKTFLAKKLKKYEIPEECINSS